MNPKYKKYLIFGLIVPLTITGAMAYLQYKKLMNYTLKPAGIRIKKIAFDLFSFDIYVNIDNKSDIGFTIIEQQHKVYINDVFVNDIVSTTPSLVAPKGVTKIPLSISFNPKEVLVRLKQTALTLAGQSDKINIKIVTKMKVKVFGIKVSIPYTYQDTLKNMLSTSSV